MVTRVSISLDLYFEDEADALSKMQIAEIALSQMPGYSPAGIKVRSFPDVEFSREHTTGAQIPEDTPRQDWLSTVRHTQNMQTVMPRHTHHNPSKTVKQEFVTLIKALNKADSRVPADPTDAVWAEYYQSWGEEGKVVSLTHPVVTAGEVIALLSTVMPANEATSLIAEVMPVVDKRINRGLVPSSLDYSELLEED